MQILKTMLSSKKFIAMLAGLVATLVAKIGWNVDTETINQAIALVVSYVVGQGIADAGKEKAKAENGNGKS
jgi:uncharacterized membrane protein (DUF441 family)